MDELQMVRELLDERPPPTPHAVGSARARLDRLTTRPARTLSLGRPPRLPGTVGRRFALGLTTATAAVAAALVAVALPALIDTGAGPVPDGGTPPAAAPAQPPPADAEQVLLVAAQHADEAAAQSGRYWHVRTLTGHTMTRVGQGADAYTLEQRGLTETWMPPDAHEAGWIGTRQLGTRPATPADEEAWRRAGSPSQWDLGPTDTVDKHHHILRTTPDEGRLSRINGADRRFPLGEGRVTAAEVATLPTDPAALREHLLRLQRQTSNVAEPELWLFTSATMLLADTPAPAPVRAAAFRLLADLPGVQTHGSARDPLGRTGQAVTLTRHYQDGTSTHQLIIDPATGQLLAIVHGGSGVAKHGYTAILELGWTNEDPQIPSAEVS